ncbi:MAG: hypothetical protein E6J69_01995 [Deltaproteobacteria bacterium]|nr:MAG: hypothetical protein E6J69_01995 [Deltaproteobacteria bacterium]
MRPYTIGADLSRLDTPTIDKLVDAALRTVPMQPTSGTLLVRIVNEASSTRGARRLGCLMLALAVLFGAGGCTAVGRGMSSAVGSKYAKADSGITWNVPAPELELTGGNRTAYLSYRNISDASDIDLRSAFQGGIQDRGYRVVDNPEQATYRLRVTVRYFGENEAADGGESLAAGLGVISGAAVGVGTGIGVARATGSGIAGGITGGVAGAAAGLAVNSAMQVREWDAIADIVLEERLPKPVDVDVQSDRSTESTTATGAVTAHGGTRGTSVGGGARDATSATMAIKRKTNYFPHGIRVTGWARQVRMTREEAIPLIQGHLRSAVPNLLP